MFATFESEEGYQRAKKYNELVDSKTVEDRPEDLNYTHYEKILGEIIDVEEA